MSFLSRLLLCLTLVASGPSLLCAASAPDTPQESPAQRLLEEGRRALEAGNYSAALVKLERSYSSAALPDVLYELGRVAQAEGRTIAAADLYRRYQASIGSTVDPRIKQTLNQFAANIRESTTEIDVASGDAGALLRVDGRVVGVLPLETPILVASGAHRFQLEKSGQKFQTTPLPVPPGQRLQLQITLTSQVAFLTFTPGVVFLITSSGIPEALELSLTQALTAATRSERAFLVARAQIADALSSQPGAPSQASCFSEPDCQERLARKVDAASVITLSLHPSATAPKQVRMQLLDVASGMVAATAEQECGACSSSELQSLVTQGASNLLRELANRTRGTLMVTSSPSSARVVVAGRVLGTTPFSRETLAGPLEVTVEQDGFIPSTTRVEVIKEQSAAVAATLQKIPVQHTIAGRPRWRFIAGGIAIGSGILLIGFSASAFAATGSCVSPAAAPAQACDYVYSTTAVGGGLLGAGIGLTAGGIGLMAWPGKPEAPSSRASANPN